MLQLARLSQDVIDEALERGELPERWDTMQELEEAADRWMSLFFERRRELAERRGGLQRIRCWLDDQTRTDAVEFMDRPDYPADHKVRLVQALDQLNRAQFAYARWMQILAPRIRRVERQLGRPARVLELASGAGEMTFALERQARREGLAVDLTASDVVAAHVDTGAAEAARRGSNVRFRRVNAFDMSDIDEGEYDLVFIAQAAHHFTPGQLAMMIAQSSRVASDAFVAIDGERALWLMGYTVAIGAAGSVLARRPEFLHDAVVSGRRFYSEPELQLLALLGAPGRHATVRGAFPGYTVLTVA